MSTPRIRKALRPRDEGLVSMAQRLGVPVPGTDLLASRIASAPCSRACPAGINVKRYVGLVAEGLHEDALRTIREANPLAAVCGHLCSRPCEVECALAETGHPIPIRGLKRLAARVVADTGAPPEAPVGAPRAERVAVVGGGPAGLTAARDLRRYGYGVTLIESQSQLGGLLACEVPPERLPRDALAADIAYVLAHDVDVQLDTTIGPGGIDQLFNVGFGAVLLATGARRGVRTRLQGGVSEADGVTHALDVARALADGRQGPFSRAVVLGAGPMALAVAGGLARRGGSQVTVIHQRGPTALPADPADVGQLEASGVRFLHYARPLSIREDGGRVVGLEVARLKPGRPLGPGRPVLSPISELDLAADLVVFATDRAPDLHYLGRDAPGGLALSPLGTIRVTPEDLETSRPMVFAAGEVAAGGRSVIEAIAMGRRAAAAIHARLSGAPRPEVGHGRAGGIRLRHRYQKEITSGWQHLPDSSEEQDDAEELLRTPFGSFDVAAAPVCATLEPRAQEEARRCLRCGPCEDCHHCSVHCPEGHVAGGGPGSVLARIPRDLPRDLQDGDFERTVARVEPHLCRGCGLCEEHCPYAAPRVVLRPGGYLTAAVEARFCRGCGLCVGLCPTGALEQGHFTNRHLAGRVDRLLGVEEEA